jgi:TolB protein
LPQWVPDGGRIIFSTTLDANDEIFSVNTDGSGLRNLTNSPAFDVTPVLSPDGTHVVFDSDRENPTASTGIHILNVDSAEVARFMYLAGGASCAAGCGWSPDGAYAAVVVYSIAGEDESAFNDVAISQPGVYLVTADGSVVTRLTTTAATGLDWVP